MKNLIELFKPIKNSSYNIILQMKFIATIAAANALQVSSESLAKHALEAAQPEEGGIIMPGVSNFYTLVPKGCVNGKNISFTSDQTVQECAQLCDADDECLAFEYGVSHGEKRRGRGGSHKKSKFKPGDCQLNFSAKSKGCDGGLYNLDLYVKN